MPPSVPLPRPGSLLALPTRPRSLLSGRPHQLSSLRPYSSKTEAAPSSSPSPSTTSPSQQQHKVRIPPESPRYVKLPTPPQSSEDRPPPVRGHLPVPREIFPGRPQEAARKADAATFVARAAPPSRASLAGEPPRSQVQALRRRLADSRRANLEQGLRGLWARREARERRERARVRNVYNAHRRAALFRPEGRDDVLTRPTVRASTAAVTKVEIDPLRRERQLASAERTARLAALRSEGRREALMELYVAAGNFIVDEADLQRRVDELFREDHFDQIGYSYGSAHAENVWDVLGKPSTVADLMAGVRRAETRLHEARRSEADRTTKRQKIVAEVLTGGKMPS